MALTKVTNTMISGATINPDDLGADPTGTNDSSAAIQAAIDTGKTVLFSNGAIYKITSGITIDNGQIVDGNWATLKPVGTFSAITLNSSGLILRNMVIDATSLTGIVINAPDEIGGGTFFIEQINVTGGTVGLSMANQYSAYITNCRFAYCEDYSLYLTSTSGFGGTNSLWFTGCYFVNSGSSGLPVVYLKTNAGIYFDKCTWQANNPNTIGVQVESVNGLYLTNNYVEEYNTTRWLWLNNSTTANVIQFIAVRDNYFLMDGIPVVFGTNSNTTVQITGNTFQTTGSSSGAAVQGMVAGFIPQVHSNFGSRADIDDTFTPTMEFGNAHVGIAYDVQDGSVRNYGNYLEGGIHIKLTAKGTSVGDVTINVPSTMLIGVTGQNISGDVQTGFYAGMASITSMGGGFLDNSSIRLYNDTATAAVALTNANFTDTSELYVKFKSPFVNISQ